MKRVLLFLFVMLGLAVSGFSQNDKISYQAVVRNSANQIVYNTELTVTINIANGEGGDLVYSERHTVTSNANGLISLLIGDGEVLSGSWDAVPWNTAYMSASIANTGSSETVASHALPLSAVPYAMYAGYADSVNTEVIAHYLLENGYLAVDSTLFFNLLDSLRLLDQRIIADSTEFANYLSNASSQIGNTLDSIAYILNYLQLMNQASIEGDFTYLVDSLGAISWRLHNNYNTKTAINNMLSQYATRAALDSTDAAIRADFPVVNNATLTIKSNGDSIGVFTANANENVIIDIPAQANVQSDWNQTDTTADDYIKHKPELFSGNYDDLTNKPEIPTVPTDVSAFNNDAGYLTSYTEQQVITISNDTLFLTGGSFVKLPQGSDGDYNSLTNKPSIKDTVSNAIHDSIVNNISQQIHDSISNIQLGSDNVQSDWNQDDVTADDYIKNKPELFSGNYEDLAGKPELFDGDYNSLTNKPSIKDTVSDAIHDSIVNNISQQIHDSISNIQIGSDNVQSDWNQTDTTADDYIKHKPTKLTDFVNDAGFLTEANVQEAANIPTNVSAFTNDAGYITSDTVSNAIHDSIVNNISQQIHDSISSHPETDPLFTAWDKNYNDLTYKPELFSGDYNDLTNTPTIPTVPTNVGAFTNDAGYITSETVGNTIHDSIVNNISQQIHDSISNIQIGSDNVQSDWNQTDTTADDYIKHKPALFSGDYDDLTNKPAIPTVPTNVSAFTNDAGYLTSDSALIENMLDSLQNLSLRLKADSAALQHHIEGTSNIPQIIDSLRTALANINVTNQAVNGDFSQLIGSINTLTARLNNDYYTKVKINDTLDDYYTKTQVDSVSTQIRSEIPAVHNATLTIRSNGDSIGVFTANANENVIIDIPAQANVQSDWSQTDTTADDYIKHKPELFSGDYDDLTNKPELFDGDYNSLTNKPSIKDTVSNAIHDSIVNRISAQIHDSISVHPETDPQFTAWGKDYNTLVNKPELFDGNYNSLINKPSIKDSVSNAIHDSIVNRISAQIHDSISVHPETDPQFNAWDKDYNDLINRPTIPTVPTDVSSFNNDAGYLTADSALIESMLDSLQNLSQRLKADSAALQSHLSGATHDILQEIDSIKIVLASINITNQAVNGDFSNLLNNINELKFRVNNYYYTISQVDSISSKIRSEIPTVHNATLSIKNNGESLGQFTANANQNVTIDVSALSNVQSDWNQADNTKDDYIKNKPELFNGDYNSLTNKPSIKDTVSNAIHDSIVNRISAQIHDSISGITETDPTVPAWAKAAEKPTYDYSEIQNTPDIPTVPDDVSAFNNDAGYITDAAIHDSIVNRISQQIHDSISGITETDPTVPAWAKETEKPTYDYSEIQNTPDIPTVPTDISAFNNDSGYLTEYTETDPTVPAWAKTTDKPTYDYSEIENTPAIPTVPTDISAFNNDSGYLTEYSESDPTVPAWAKEAEKPTYDYSEIENTPAIPTVPTDISAFNNDAGFITAADIPSIQDIPTNLSEFNNDAGFITSYTETDPQFNAWDKDYNDLINTPSINDSISEAIHDSLNMLKKGIRDVTDTAYTSSLLPVEKSKILIIDEDQDPQIPVFKICQLDKKPNNAYLVKIFINGVLVGDNAPANDGSDSHYAPVLRVEKTSSEKYEIKYDSDKNEGYLLEKGDKIILYWFE